MQLPRREETGKSKENVTVREHAFSGIHDGKPVEPPKSLGDQVRKEEVAEAAKNQPPIPEKLPCQEGKPCPGGRNYLIKQQILGDKCGAGVGLIKLAKYCPILQREKAAAANAGIFTTAGQPRPIIDERPAALSGLPRATSGPPSLVIKPNEKQWNVLKQIVREDLAETLEEAMLYLIDEKAEQMEAA